jgi:hypothetical protein
VPKYVFDENFFECIDTENKAYWLGFLYADGCILDMKLKDGTKVPQTVQLTLSVDDIEVIYKFMNDIKLEKNVYFGSYNRDEHKIEYCRLQVGSGKMCSDLISYGCTPRKTKILQFPKNISENLIKHFIRGYFDGDGSVYFCERMQYRKDRNKYQLQKSFCCSFQGTYDFLLTLENILNNNNISTRPIRNGHGDVFCLEFGRRDSMINFYHYIYDNSTVFLSRKYCKFIDTFKYLNLAY